MFESVLLHCSLCESFVILKPCVAGSTLFGQKAVGSELLGVRDGGPVDVIRERASAGKAVAVDLEAIQQTKGLQDVGGAYGSLCGLKVDVRNVTLVHERVPPY